MFEGVRFGPTDSGGNTWTTGGNNMPSGTKAAKLGKTLAIAGLLLWGVGKFALKG